MLSSFNPASPTSPNTTHHFRLSLLTIAVLAAAVHSPAVAAAEQARALELEQITVSATRQAQSVDSVPSTVRCQRFARVFASPWHQIDCDLRAASECRDSSG